MVGGRERREEGGQEEGEEEGGALGARGRYSSSPSTPPGGGAPASTRSTTSSRSSQTAKRSVSSGEIMPSARARSRSQSTRPPQYDESTRQTGNSLTLPVWMSVSASKSSSSVPKPPGRTTNAFA